MITRAASLPRNGKLRRFLTKTTWGVCGIVIAAVFGPGVAQAADLPVKGATPTPAPAAPPTPAYNWNGCYVGANAGGAASGSDFTSRVDPGTHLTDPLDLAAAGATGTGSYNSAGFIGGGQVGCNFHSGAFLVGAEGDWDYFRSTPSFTSPNGTLGTGDTVTVTQSLRTNDLATVRARFGMVADRVLVYVTGGAAFARVSYAQNYFDTLNSATGATSGSKTLSGWTAGGGWEWAWVDNWTVKVEYLLAKFPTIATSGGILDTAGGANVLHGSANLTIQTARVGLNYRF